MRPPIFARPGRPDKHFRTRVLRKPCWPCIGWKWQLLPAGPKRSTRLLGHVYSATCIPVAPLSDSLIGNGSVFFVGQNIAWAINFRPTNNRAIDI